MCRQTNALSDSSVDNDDHLGALEAELTKAVPDLFEAMNRASSEVNMFEHKASEAQGRYKQCLDQWSRLYKGFRLRHGAAIDCAKPYFDHVFAFEVVSRRVRYLARKLSETQSEYTRAQAKLHAIDECFAFGAHEVSVDADQQDGFTRAMVRVMQCKQEYLKCEQDHTCALREYHEVKGALNSWRAHVKNSTIRCMEPYFKQLRHYQLLMAAEEVRIADFSKSIGLAKKTYNKSMCDLESISIAVHQAREEHANSTSGTT